MLKRKTAALAAGILLIIVIVAAGIVVTFQRAVQPCSDFRENLVQNKDFQRISYEIYDSVFLSMFSIENYAESDFTDYVGTTVLKTDNVLPDFSGIERYLRHIEESENLVSTVYLGLCPEKVSVRELSALMQRYPSISFEIILPFPSASYWKKLSEEEFTQLLAAYETFLTDAGQFPDTKFYFLSAEDWLINNPTNYVNDYDCSEFVVHKMFLYTFCDNAFRITSENADKLRLQTRDVLTAVRENAPTYPDFSEYDIVFWGDSIIGNYTGSLSIPGVINGLTGAAVYNCGYGGTSASLGPETSVSLPGIVKAFFEKDLSEIPTETQIYEGFLSYINAPHIDKKTCYVIHYGINDYFRGHPISSDDPLDITTYAGAIRNAVACIKENSPDSQIILCTPIYCGYATDESDEPGIIHLQEYVDAVFALAEELDVDVLDNFYAMGVNSSNYEEYLLDMVHPNEKYRFMIAQKVIESIR